MRRVNETAADAGTGSAPPIDGDRNDRDEEPTAQGAAQRRDGHPPGGNSIPGCLNPGEDLVLASLTPETTLRIGTIVLAKVRRQWVLHQIIAMDGKRVEIAATPAGIVTAGSRGTG